MPALRYLVLLDRVQGVWLPMTWRRRYLYNRGTLRFMRGGKEGTATIRQVFGGKRWALAVITGITHPQTSR